MPTSSTKISICIPHWQVLGYIQPCLRSIRKHSEQYDIDVIVVDNGSKDESIDYLRSLDWIRLIERPDEVHTNWPANVFSAWDRAIVEARGEFYVTMHSDVFVKSDNWLDPFLREFRGDSQIAATGSWKLPVENSFYAWQKKTVNAACDSIKGFFGGKRSPKAELEGRYPRDYCAMYRVEPFRKHSLTFGSINGYTGGGYSIARQLNDFGYRMGMFPVREMDRLLFHVAHGTAAIKPEKQLHHRRKQLQTEQKVKALFSEVWIKDLQTDQSLDQRAA
ncbi:MAG: glycosyltransferase family 2 protein [Planctomycetaceae bacterium]